MDYVSIDTFKKACVMSCAGLISYVLAIAEKMGREEALRILARLHAGMADMVKENLSSMGIEGSDARAGAKLLDMIMGEHMPGLFEIMERSRVIDTPQQVVTRQKGFCHVLEACQMLGLSVSDFCPILHEEGFSPIVQVLNPGLRVRVGKLRPEADYCELIVELLPGTVTTSG
ncbi:MAG: hypothetical protein AB1538_01575 [Bacillota bacterium]